MHAGQFAPADLAKLQVPATEVLWDQARLVLGLSDLHGVKDAVTVAWGGQTLTMAAGTDGAPTVPVGMHALLPR